MERLFYIISHSFKVLLSTLMSFINLDFIFYQCGMRKPFFLNYSEFYLFEHLLKSLFGAT